MQRVASAGALAKEAVMLDPIVQMDHPARVERARLTVEGLSTGDAFGAAFRLPPDMVRVTLDRTKTPAPPWRTGDDTSMALAVLDTLVSHGTIAQDELAWKLAARAKEDPYRGWGAGTRRVLDAVSRGLAWQVVAPVLHEGGSHGAGAAARSATVGAWFADDLEETAAQAQLAAEVTHAHTEAHGGAIAVAVAVAVAWRLRHEGARWAGPRLLDTVTAYVPAGPVRDALRRAQTLRLDQPIERAVRLLGNGETSLTGVPLAIWCAARHLDDYAEAMWTAVGARGNADTTCAIVGGIVAQSSRTGVPARWVASREVVKLPIWRRR